jgi:hypothetical protein
MKIRTLFAPDSPSGFAPATPKPATPAPAAPAPIPASTPAPTTPEPSDDPFEPPKKATPTVTPKLDDKPAAVAPDDIDKLAPKELRERVKQLKAESQAATSSKSVLEKKIAEYEASGKDTTALTGRLSALEKERDSALAELRAAKQEASPEFKEKYEKPFNQAAERARKSITELSVVLADDGTTRPATWQDFAAIYQLPVGKAIEQATALFGNSAQFVLGLREKLLDLDAAKTSALEEERAQFKTRNEQEVANQAKERETVFGKWKDTNSKLAESNPDYKDDPTDTEASEARKHALSIFDSEIKAADRQDFIEKKVLRDAHVRQRVGAFPVLKLALARAHEKLETAQKQIEELKGAAPGKVQRPGGGAPPAAEEDWGEGLVKAVKD